MGRQKPPFFVLRLSSGVQMRKCKKELKVCKITQTPFTNALVKGMVPFVLLTCLLCGINSALYADSISTVRGGSGVIPDAEAPQDSGAGQKAQPSVDSIDVNVAAASAMGDYWNGQVAAAAITRGADNLPIAAESYTFNASQAGEGLYSGLIPSENLTPTPTSIPTQPPELSTVRGGSGVIRDADSISTRRGGSWSPDLQGGTQPAAPPELDPSTIAAALAVPRALGNAFVSAAAPLVDTAADVGVNAYNAGVEGLRRMYIAAQTPPVGPAAVAHAPGRGQIPEGNYVPVEPPPAAQPQNYAAVAPGDSRIEPAVAPVPGYRDDMRPASPTPNNPFVFDVPEMTAPATAVYVPMVEASQSLARVNVGPSPINFDLPQVTQPAMLEMAKSPVANTVNFDNPALRPATLQLTKLSTDSVNFDLLNNFAYKPALIDMRMASLPKIETLKPQVSVIDFDSFNNQVNRPALIDTRIATMPVIKTLQPQVSVIDFDPFNNPALQPAAVDARIAAIPVIKALQPQVLAINNPLLRPTPIETKIPALAKIPLDPGVKNVFANPILQPNVAVGRTLQLEVIRFDNFKTPTLATAQNFSNPILQPAAIPISMSELDVIKYQDIALPTMARLPGFDRLNNPAQVPALQPAMDISKMSNLGLTNASVIKITPDIFKVPALSTAVLKDLGVADYNELFKLPALTQATRIHELDIRPTQVSGFTVELPKMLELANISLSRVPTVDYKIPLVYRLPNSEIAMVYVKIPTLPQATTFNDLNMPRVTSSYTRPQDLKIPDLPMIVFNDGFKMFEMTASDTKVPVITIQVTQMPLLLDVQKILAIDAISTQGYAQLDRAIEQMPKPAVPMIPRQWLYGEGKHAMFGNVSLDRLSPQIPQIYVKDISIPDGATLTLKQPLSLVARPDTARERRIIALAANQGVDVRMFLEQVKQALIVEARNGFMPGLLDRERFSPQLRGVISMDHQVYQQPESVQQPMNVTTNTIRGATQVSSPLLP